MTDAPHNWAIEARGVSYAYPRGSAALRDVSLRVGSGQAVAVLGANGSGKTTLLKVLMRLLSPQQGQVWAGGDDVTRLRPADLYRRVGMVFQNPNDQLFGPNVEQDVAFGPRNLGLPEDEVRQRTQEALAAVDAWELAPRPIHQLSFGQQKRVCLAAVLAMRPPILLLDEPTAGLDPAAETQMIELLRRLNRQQGTTIVFCTHAVDFLPATADRVCILRQGSVWREGTPAEVFADAQSVAAAGLRLPLVAQLFADLNGCGGNPAANLPLTLAAARERLAELAAGDKPKDCPATAENGEGAGR